MANKLCIYCKQFELDMGWPGTDITAGDNAVIECKRGNWAMQNYDRAKEYRKNILSAENCQYYEQVDDTEE